MSAGRAGPRASCSNRSRSPELDSDRESLVDNGLRAKSPELRANLLWLDAEKNFQKTCDNAFPVGIVATLSQ
jgi:hypothetical protein